MNENIFGENLKKLRQAHEETQKQLGEKIAIKDNYISMLERGRRQPSNDIIRAVANHYRMASEDLFRFIEIDGYPIKNLTISLDDCLVTIDIMFPFFQLEKAVEDFHFNCALKMHKKTIKNIKNYQSSDLEDRLSILVEKYWETWQKNKTIEALANILSVLCRWCGSLGTESMIKTEESIRKYGYITGKQIKDIYLREGYAEDPLENVKKEFAIQNEKMIEECLKTLKRDSKWSDVADYYLCIIYIVGMIDNEYSIDENCNIGMEMLQRFSLMGNPYAQACIEHMARILNK